MMNGQNHSPQKKLSLEHLWLLIRKTEDKDETISSTSTQDFDREKVEREFINLASHYQQIREISRRSSTYEKSDN